MAEHNTDNESVGRTLLLIDEPELYLHPQAVTQMRSALEKLSRQSYQILYATHSPQLIGVGNLASTLVIAKDGAGGTFARERLQDVIPKVLSDAKSQARALLDLENASQILFSDLVLITEGKTEQRIIPEVVAIEKGVSLGEAKIGLVSAGGAAGTANCLKVLSAIGVRAKALVDLDFAFRHGIKTNLVDDADPDVQKCREICTQIASNHGFALAPDGFPKNSPSISAADAFNALAMEADAGKPIGRLHEKLKMHGIWLWRRGSLEHHLGLSGKSEEAWADYVLQLRQKGCASTISDYVGVCEFLEWLTDTIEAQSKA